MHNNTRRFRKQRALCLTRDNYTCTYCGEYGDQADHIYPRSLAMAAGWTEEETDSLSNLQTLCFKCNNRKSNKINTRHTWIRPGL